MEIYLKENIQKLMKQKDLSMRSLSLLAGLSEDSIKKILKNANQNPRIDTVIKIAEALSTDVNELLFGKRLPGNNSIYLNKDLLKKAIISIDSIIEEKNISLSAEERTEAYFIWYELENLDIKSDYYERFNTVLRLIK